MQEARVRVLSCSRWASAQGAGWAGVGLQESPGPTSLGALHGPGRGAPSEALGGAGGLILKAWLP